MNPEEEENVRKIVREELTKSNNGNNNNGSSGKKKKGPNKWQLFLKDCLKEQPKGTALGDRVKGCSIEYKNIKEVLQIGPDGKLINPTRKEVVNPVTNQ